MSPAIQRFLELERKKADIKKYFEELNKAVEDVIKEVGVGAYFQDPSDGTVFKTVIPDGRYVAFDKYGYHRTRRAHLGEKKGDLSLTEATTAGFTLPE